MPRKARIDAPGALHHNIVRGIERRKIFYDNSDRKNFLDRLGAVLSETNTLCFAWALIPIHLYMLLKTGATPITTVMRTVLEGHGVIPDIEVTLDRSELLQGKDSQLEAAIKFILKNR